MSLAAARGAIEALHTAPLPRLVTPEEVDEEAPANDGEEGEEMQGGVVREEMQGGVVREHLVY
jgi:hypothetical protein